MAIPATFIDSPHTVLTKTPDGKDLAFLTGTAGFEFKGTGGNWRHEFGMIKTPAPRWAAVFSAAPTASLASVANDHTAVQEGYAADNVNYFVSEDLLWLQVLLAVRDSDGHLYRVSYQVTVLGVILG
jgi:hypothetical protein